MTTDRPHDLEPTDEELLAEIDAELAAEAAGRRRAPERVTGAVLLLGGAVSWVAALVLMIDKLFLLENPGAQLGCDINPFISCGDVMSTWQAATFGIPNMAIGLAGYAIMACIGSLLLSGAQLPRWFSWATLGGMTFAFGFIQFLAISAIFVIKALCPWCMLVWLMTAPMFFAVLARTIESGTWRAPAPLAAVLRHWVVLSIVWYALVVLAILGGFWRQWLYMVGLG